MTGHPKGPQRQTQKPWASVLEQGMQMLSLWPDPLDRLYPREGYRNTSEQPSCVDHMSTVKLWYLCLGLLTCNLKGTSSNNFYHNTWIYSFGLSCPKPHQNQTKFMYRECIRSSTTWRQLAHISQCMTPAVRKWFLVKL